MRTQLTIKDVARRAGVSAMSVSRVLNRSGYVTDEMRVRVEAAVKETGYVPNHVARGLRSRKTGTIALILSDVTNPFFTTVARGAEDAASDADNLILLCNTDEDEAEELRYMNLLIQKQVDGILLVPARSGVQSVELARRHGVQVVVLDRTIQLPDVDVVRCDPLKGAFELGKLLSGFGHRTFAVLAGPKGVSTSDDRIEGFKRAIESTTTSSHIAVHHGEFNFASGALTARTAMKNAPTPTAIFAVNNFLAAGALREIRTLGFRVPEDVALVGYDDFFSSMVEDPFITTVFQPAYEMGRQGVNLLFQRLEAKTDFASQSILLPTELQIRQSSGGLKA